MKEHYSEPQLDIITFSIADIINTSADEGDGGVIRTTLTTNENGGIGGPNEGEFGDECL